MHESESISTDNEALDAVDLKLRFSFLSSGRDRLCKTRAIPIRLVCNYGANRIWLKQRLSRRGNLQMSSSSIPY